MFMWAPLGRCGTLSTVVSELILLKSMIWYHTVTLEILLYGDNILSPNQNCVFVQCSEIPCSDQTI